MPGRTCWTFVVAVALLATMSPLPLRAAQAGPLSVVEQAFAAQSRGDVAGALALYDAVASVQGGACPIACLGVPAIQKQLQDSVTQGFRIRVLRGTEVGNVATGRYEATWSQLPPDVERIVGDFTAYVTAGKITSLTLGVDASDAETAAALRAIQGLPPAATEAAETTVVEQGAEDDVADGDEDTSRLGLIGLVLLALAAGLLALRWRSQRRRLRRGRVVARGIRRR